MKIVNAFLMSTMLTFFAVPLVQASAQDITAEDFHAKHDSTVACGSSPFDPRPCP